MTFEVADWRFSGGDRRLSAVLQFGARTSPVTNTAGALQRQVRLLLPLEALRGNARAVRADRRVLVVLQAVNAGGKDGTIAEIASSLDAARLRIERFRRPPPGTSWQAAFASARAAAPATGEIVFFNRSYYEEILRAVLTDGEEQDQITAAILELENDLAAQSTVVLKLFLHIDQDEQRRRLDRRQEQPDLVHLHNRADYDDQERWDELMAAYEKVLTLTHTATNPWLVIPANSRQTRNALVAELLRPHLRCER